MQKYTLLLLATALPLGMPHVMAYSGANAVVVTGEGISRAEAKERALRKALEEGGEVFITAQSHVHDFQLLRDAIYSKAEGILRDVEVLEERVIIGGTYLCRLRATVILDSLAREWGDLKLLLEANGNPRIVVTISERIDNELQDYSTIEAKISGYLARKGFSVLNKEQLERIANRHSQRFDIADMKFLQWVARNEGAEVFLNGTSSASFARWHKAGGANVAIYNCNADISMFNSDDASLIARVNTAQFQGGARTDHAPSIEAGKMALDNAGEDLFHRIYSEALMKWTSSVAGPREILVEVRAVPNLGIAIRIETMLREIEGVGSVERSFDMGVATFRISAKMSANVLSNHLVVGDWERILSIEESQRNVIRGVYIGVVPQKAIP